MRETRIIYNYSRLLGRMKEQYGTQEAFAKALGMGRVSLNQRLNSKMEFSLEEIEKAVKLLGLENLDIPGFFFCPQQLETQKEYTSESR